MFIGIAPSTAGVYYATHGATGQPQGQYKTIKEAKIGVEQLIRQYGTYIVGGAMIIDLDSFKVVAHVATVPPVLPWVDVR